MGDINQLLYLRKFVPAVTGAILEIGSKDYGSTVNFRAMFPDNNYTGVDMEDGKGVDAILDLTQGTGSLHKESFALIICCSVMEHTPRPWVMAEHIVQLLAPGGKLFLSVPWVWRYHAYPDDYFRFSLSGIRSLFSALSWSDAHYSTNCEGEFVAITPEQPGIDNALAKLVTTPEGRQRKYLPYFMVNAIGIKA